jgi:LacI family transcriptional regulator
LGIKTDHVVEHLGISRSSLESHFRQDLGRSVHDEILRCRLVAAMAMLERDDCNLADVAFRCSFSSSQYMHLVFKRELGLSPRAYQERLHRSRDEASKGLCCINQRSS